MLNSFIKIYPSLNKLVIPYPWLFDSTPVITPLEAVVAPAAHKSDVDVDVSMSASGTSRISPRL
jgi:hypothetical protein